MARDADPQNHKVKMLLFPGVVDCTRDSGTPGPGPGPGPQAQAESRRGPAASPQHRDSSAGPGRRPIWNLCTSDKSDVKSISKYIQVYDGIYFIY